ncbi:type II secretion system protein GspD [Victivallis lenta]|uniref:type II secretion system protein GspD n=1 Tax=Victivallis lenta TaxID=2606640 RepID=UPI003AF295F3
MNNKIFLLPVALFSASVLTVAETIKLVPEQIPGKPKADFNAPSAGYGSSSVQAQLRLEVKDGTKAIHFIRDNNDPYVITRTYELKHADPYGLRWYLNAIINAKRVDQNQPSVAALKFNNGRKLLIVSAEAYRFEDDGYGESIDKLVERLDQPGLTASSGRPKFIYFPKINSAATLKKMVSEVGASAIDVEFDNGVDKLIVDGGLNALFVAAPFWSWKHISNMLAQYDRPIPEIRFRYKVVEIFAENDDRIGLDFQSWKNNDGADFFSAGGRFRSNWASTFGAGVNNSGSSKTEFFNFNPKWNSKYIDFLTSRGKARVLTSGVLNAKNRTTTSINVGSGLFYDDVSQKIEPGNTGRLPAPFAGEPDVPDAGKLEIRKGQQQITKVGEGFRFSLDLVEPIVTANSTTLKLHAESVSLIGWDSSGEPRLNKSEIETEVQIGNSGKNFVIGGLKKFDVVRGVAGVPLLKDLPLLGWLFSTESESTKKSQIVILASAEYSTPFDPVPTEIQANVGKIVEDVRAGVRNPLNNLGFEQYGIDSDTIE